MKTNECKYDEHDWEYLESGHNYWGHYWMDKKCKICGKTQTDYVD